MSEDEAAFPIPDPPSEPPRIEDAKAERSFGDALREGLGFERKELTKAAESHADWRLQYGLRLVFFGAALWVNWWWDRNVCAMVWQSGRERTGFHLSDKVLIALLTTSIANFLVLLTIIARFLFHTIRGTESDA